MQLHPSQISPSDPYDIFYFIRNHTDSTTYYVQAVVYDIRTGAVLSTLPLTRSTTNTRLYTTTTQAPSDPSGYGRNIVAVATVYTDSGYTTKSTDYEEQEQYFLVKNSVSELFVGGGGVDYRELRHIVAEELDTRLSTQLKPFDGVLGAIGAIQREVNRIPKELDTEHILFALDDLSRKLPKETDLSSVIDRLKRIQATLDALPEPEKVDLTDLAQGFASLSEAIHALDQRRATDTGATLDMLRQEISHSVMEMEKRITEVINSQELSFPVQRSVKSATQTQPSVDIQHLMQS